MSAQCSTSSGTDRRAVEPARCYSFAPVVRAGARILILGSMPGVASLAAQQYYAHPRNQFWQLMGGICGARQQLPYPRRLEYLQDHDLALWDVLQFCERRGSLDSAIDHRTAITNDVPGLLRQYPSIRRVCCNGGTAYAALRRHYGKQLHSTAGIEVLRLPSTSAAHASWPLARKRKSWRTALAGRATS